MQSFTPKQAKAIYFGFMSLISLVAIADVANAEKVSSRVKIPTCIAIGIIPIAITGFLDCIFPKMIESAINETFKACCSRKKTRVLAEPEGSEVTSLKTPPIPESGLSDKKKTPTSTPRRRIKSKLDFYNMHSAALDAPTAASAPFRTPPHRQNLRKSDRASFTPEAIKSEKNKSRTEFNTSLALSSPHMKAIENALSPNPV